MAQESLLRKLEEAGARIKVIEREKKEAADKMQALEREAHELRSLISLAESKADEMLKGVSTFEGSRVPAAAKALPSNPSTASKGLQDLMEPSPAQQEELRRRFPNAFTA